MKLIVSKEWFLIGLKLRRKNTIDDFVEKSNDLRK
jgi:protease II